VRRLGDCAVEEKSLTMRTEVVQADKVRQFPRLFFALGAREVWRLLFEQVPSYL